MVQARFGVLVLAALSGAVGCYDVDHAPDESTTADPSVAESAVLSEGGERLGEAQQADWIGLIFGGGFGGLAGAALGAILAGPGGAVLGGSIGAGVGGTAGWMAPGGRQWPGPGNPPPRDPPSTWGPPASDGHEH